MKSAVWLLNRLIPAVHRDAVLGDLIEELALRTRTRQPNASLWLWSQALRSVLPLAWTVFRRGDWIATLAAGIAAYGLVKIAESVSAFVWPLLPGEFAHNPALLALIGLATMLFGGLLATWMRRGAAVALAGISALMVIQWISSAGAGLPFYYQLYFLIVCPAAALAGARLLRART